MPNQWGQAHPWELAGMTQPEWMKVLRYSIHRWVKAANAMVEYFDGKEAAGVDRARALMAVHRAAEDDHNLVMAGDSATCAKLGNALKSV
jgi:hypothetical protein